MSADDDTARQRWRLLREIFDLTLEQPAGERERFLEQIFLDRRLDPAMQAELREMLAADSGDDTEPVGLGEVAPDLLLEIDRRALADERAAMAGRRYGPWELAEPIGHGGMGAVWLARRREGDFQQQGALKLIRQGWDSLELRQRFRSERRILAGLQHPNIAAMLDGGETDTGQPWLVMEYVQGRTLLAHCDAEGLDLRARLELFLSICTAVAFAHRNLVVHRDLKPSNILVDRDGHLKLLDFGIAKLLEPNQAQTGTGQRMFTPEYAAPEQLRGDPVTTSVDVHALGLLLYSLLTGLRPWGQSGSTPAAYEHAVLREEATRPSQALLQDPAAVQRSQERGGLSPARLCAALRGDLDAIVMKALRKQPSERYASVDEMAADVRRHLRAEPVLARRGNWRYRAQRFLRRHALASALAAFALLSLLAGLAAALWQAERAEQARARAERASAMAEHESRRAQVVADFMTEAFRLADPGRADAVDPSARDLLRRGLEELRGRSDLDLDTRTALLLAIGSAWLALGDVPQALALFEEARAQAENSEDLQLRARALVSLSTARSTARERQLALDLLFEAKALLDTVESPADGLRRELELKIATTLSTLGRHAEAVSVLLPAWQRERDEKGPGSDDALSLLYPLTWILDSAGEREQAFELSTEAYRQAQANPRLRLLLRRGLLDAYAWALLNRREAVQAEAIFRESLALTESLYGEGHLRTFISLNNVALSLSHQGRNEEAIALRRRALEVFESQLPADDPRVLRARVQLSWELLRNRQYPLAGEMLSDSAKDWTPETRLTAVHYQAMFQLALAQEQMNALAAARVSLKVAEVALEPGVLEAPDWWQIDIEILRWRMDLREQLSADCSHGERILERPQPTRRQRSELRLLGALCRHRLGQQELAREHLRRLESESTQELSEYAGAQLPLLREALADDEAGT